MIKVLATATLLISSFNASASNASPMITKLNSTGYVPIEHMQQTKCELYQNRVVITNTFASGYKLVETKRIRLKGSLISLFRDAANEREVRKENLLCDAPSTSVILHQTAADEISNDVNIFSTGGCGEDFVRRVGPASTTLKNIIATYCPKTHQPQ
ncbi:hypothetical protein [Pseudobacteriovorax antillogorgiicola]|uniref:Uncharacterized protein n=1 Tax=Pseudobacteriovorax antillogorgiicola TaxID=1513793 RepID=A0A1Y6C7M0_9BACT|nr:hypothetical protein [Pseudobacteriovorax antillogorgiicola]TCS50749.1 hypothetical protein EDD56_112132 [Pseudobacteriovorax antillogorgiicola]SMF41072.1 hypothetical protein SAMN06296036_112131 [Pseudobacteriovorax antillogorgiicola]